MKNLFLILLFSISTLVTAQTNYYQGTSSLIVFPQGYGLKLLNSSGNSTIINDISNISFMNPASINNFNNYSAGLSYQANTSIDEAWIADFGTSRIYNFYPQSAGGIIKWDDFTFGLGFGQRYNGTIDTEPIQVTTASDPDGTGEYFNLTDETSIQSYSLSASYSLKEFLRTEFDFSVGAKYSLNRLYKYEKIWKSEVSATGYYSSFAIGLISKFNLDEQRKLMVGLSYESMNRFKAEYESSESLQFVDDPYTTRNNLNAAVISPALLYNSPSELNFDFAVDATENLQFLAGLRTVFWSVTNVNYKDQLEISLSSAYQINDALEIAIGIYSTDYKMGDKSFSKLNSELNASFLTAGLNLKVFPVSIDIAFADSHLLSGDYRKQTIGKLGIGIQL